MKKTLALILALVLALSALGALAAGKSIPIDRAHFPDKHLRSQLKYDVDINLDKKLSASELKIKDFPYMLDIELSNLKGIEYFTEMEELLFPINAVKTLNVSKNTRLKKLWCYKNKLTKVTLGKQKYLVMLDCSANDNLKKLDIGKCPKLLNIVKKGKKKVVQDQFKGKYVQWKIGKEQYIRIPANCKLMNGKNVLYKGK